MPVFKAQQELTMQSFHSISWLCFLWQQVFKSRI